MSVVLLLRVNYNAIRSEEIIRYLLREVLHLKTRRKCWEREEAVIAYHEEKRILESMMSDGV